MTQPQQTQTPPGRDHQLDPLADHGERSYTGSGRLEGKAAVITGGDSGIGRAVAIAFAREGADVLLSYLEEDDDAQETARWVEEAGRTAVLVPGDIADRGHCRAVIDRAVEAFGRVDVLVNNAGLTRDGLLLRMRDEDWHAVLRADLDGAFFCLRAAAKVMLRQRSGRIVNIASVAGVGGNIGQANYSAAKAGLIGLTRALAREFASRGVTVNAVAPGWIETDMTAGAPPAVVEQVRERIPLGRLGAVEDVAQAVLFLASPAAAYVTGQVLVVDGGLSMSL